MCCIRCVVPDVTPMYCARCYTDVLYPMLYPMYCARCYTDVLYPMLHPMCCTRCVAPDLRLCVSRGVAPISTYCPYRARYLLNPVIGGTQGVVHSVHYTLG